jgi:hypothetical protein
MAARVCLQYRGEQRQHQDQNNQKGQNPFVHFIISFPARKQNEGTSLHLKHNTIVFENLPFMRFFPKERTAAFFLEVFYKSL